MMPKYEHTQKGSRLVGYIAIFIILELIAMESLVYILATRSEEVLPQNQLIMTMLLIGIIPILLFGWVYLFMSSPTVSVDQDYVRMRFGPSVWMKKFRLEQITGCRPVKDDWINGWGIHYIGKHCWLYNIAGLDAVEITFKSGKKVRIGTDESEKLAQIIEEAIA